MGRIGDDGAPPLTGGREAPEEQTRWRVGDGAPPLEKGRVSPEEQVQ